jgi:hypothetical protein
MSAIKAWLEELSCEMGQEGEITDEVIARGEEIIATGGGFDLDD